LTTTRTNAFMIKGNRISHTQEPQNFTVSFYRAESIPTFLTNFLRKASRMLQQLTYYIVTKLQGKIWTSTLWGKTLHGSIKIWRNFRGIFSGGIKHIEK
jgi:hypothetical protein